MKEFKLVFIFLLSFFFFVNHNAYSQLVVSRDAPYNSFSYLVDSLLLGGGVVTSNLSFQGDSLQIGFFKNSIDVLDLDSGLIISSGQVYEILIDSPLVNGYTTDVTDDDLLEIGNSVSDLVQANFSIPFFGNVVIVEFDFVPVSNSMEFKYSFASCEYGGLEFTKFSDAFIFLLSGPGIEGPYSSPPEFPDGSINIATIESTAPNSLGRFTNFCFYH